MRGGVSKAKPPCPFFLSATSLASKGIRQTPLAWSRSHRPTLDTSILLMENSTQGVEDPPAGDIVSSALWWPKAPSSPSGCRWPCPESRQ